MKKLTVFIFLVIFTAMLNAQPVTKTYRQGVNGYTSCKSLDISDLGLMNNNNGTTFGDANSDWCIGKLHGNPNYGYDISPLLRFEDLQIPAGAQVISASLTITVLMWVQPSCRTIGRYVNVDWFADIIDSNGGITNAPIGWQRRFDNTPWSALGGTGEGTDLIAGKYFVIPPDSSVIPSNGYATYTVPLDAQVIQGWVNNPANNHGFKFQNDAINVHIAYVQPQRPDITKRPLLSVTYILPNGIASNHELPKEFSLGQNYPNPFNPETKISFDIPVFGGTRGGRGVYTRLTIYNSLGQEVETLVNGVLDAGNYEVTWNASAYTSGMYYYKLEAYPPGSEITGGYIQTKKMVLKK